MNNEIRFLAQHRPHAGVSPLTARDRRVMERVARRAEVARDPNPVVGARSSFGRRLADRNAAIGGSRAFILGSGAVLAACAGLSLLVLARSAFDPSTVAVLNLLLPVLAALQALLVMTGRNRQAASGASRGGLASETAIAELHDRVDRLAAQVERLARALPSGDPAPASVAGGRQALRAA